MSRKTVLVYIPLLVLLLSLPVAFALQQLDSDLVSNGNFSQADEVPLNFNFTLNGAITTYPRITSDIIVSGISGNALFINVSEGSSAAYQTKNQNFNYSRPFDLSIDYKVNNFSSDGVFVGSQHSGYCRLSDGTHPNVANTSTNNSQCYNGTSPNSPISEAVPVSLGSGWYRSVFYNVTGYDNKTDLNLDALKVGSINGTESPLVDNINFTYVDTNETVLFDGFGESVGLPSGWVFCSDLGTAMCSSDNVDIPNVTLVSGTLKINQTIQIQNDFVGSGVNFLLNSSKTYRAEVVYKTDGNGLFQVGRSADLGDSANCFESKYTPSGLVSSTIQPCAETRNWTNQIGSDGFITSVTNVTVPSTDQFTVVMGFPDPALNASGTFVHIGSLSIREILPDLPDPAPASTAQTGGGGGGSSFPIGSSTTTINSTVNKSAGQNGPANTTLEENITEPSTQPSQVPQEISPAAAEESVAPEPEPNLITGLFTFAIGNNATNPITGFLVAGAQGTNPVLLLGGVSAGMALVAMYLKRALIFRRRARLYYANKEAWLAGKNSEGARVHTDAPGERRAGEKTREEQALRRAREEDRYKISD